MSSYVFVDLLCQRQCGLVAQNFIDPGPLSPRYAKTGFPTKIIFPALFFKVSSWFSIQEVCKIGLKKIAFM
jgi:hypothetical protein